MNDSELIRAIRSREIIALTINSVIGAGIFALPATAAKILGPGSIIAFFLAGLFCLMNVLCFAELASRFDRTGGAYLYASEAFGGGIAFMVGWMFFLSRLTSVAALCNAMIGFCGFLFPIASPLREGIILSVFLLMGIANFLGVRLSTRIINVITAAKLIPLSLFILIGLFFVNWNNFAGIKIPEPGPLSETLLIAVYVFSGYEIISVPGGEVVNVRKTLPIGMLAGTIVAILFYILIQIVSVGTFPDIAQSTAPLADAAQSFLGSGAGKFISIGAILSTSGTMMGLLLLSPRILYAMSGLGQFPKPFSGVHPVYRTPHISIFWVTVAGAIVTISGTFKTLATLSAMARLVVYIGSAVALIVLRRKTPDSNGFRIPGGLLVPIFSVLISVYLLSAATKEQLIAGLIALLAGFLLYGAGKLKRRLPV